MSILDEIAEWIDFEWNNWKQKGGKVPEIEPLDFFKKPVKEEYEQSIQDIISKMPKEELKRISIIRALQGNVGYGNGDRIVGSYDPDEKKLSIDPYLGGDSTMNHELAHARTYDKGVDPLLFWETALNKRDIIPNPRKGMSEFEFDRLLTRVKDERKLQEKIANSVQNKLPENWKGFTQEEIRILFHKAYRKAIKEQ